MQQLTQLRPLFSAPTNLKKLARPTTLAVRLAVMAGIITAFTPLISTQTNAEPSTQPTKSTEKPVADQNKPSSKNASPSMGPKHGVAMHGDPKYPADFKHYDYVVPDAPKGGTLKQHAIGTFDSFNPFITKGVPEAGIGNIYATLTTGPMDEPFTEYGYIAKQIEIAEDRSWVIYHLDKNAKFHDGHPIDANDVVFSMNILKEKGRPFYQYYYEGVKEVIALDNHTVKFQLDQEEINHELPLIVGQMVVLPEHYWQDKDFTKTTLEPPVGSGPYRIATFEAGKTITYERVPDFWGAERPINIGRFNFDKLVYEYFLNPTVALQGFKAGVYDMRLENNSKFWATLYDGPPFEEGKLIKEEVKHERPVGMQGFIFNLRKPIFQDKALREALAYAFDFEWSNKSLFYDQYVRTASYYQNTELAATGLPTSEELEILTPFKDQLPPEVFTKAYAPPVTDGSGKIRSNLREATKLLKKAGYKIRDRQLYSPDAKPIQFEILIRDSAFERIILPMVKNFEVLGVKASVRRVDVSEYVELMRNFKYDMTIHSWNRTLSPGNEQRDYWHSSSAERHSSGNKIGIKDPVVDQLVELIIAAPDRTTLINRSRALDRVLQWGHYVIPNWHVNYDRLAYRKEIMKPQTTPKYGLDINTWWYDAKKL